MKRKNHTYLWERIRRRRTMKDKNVHRRQKKNAVLPNIRVHTSRRFERKMLQLHCLQNHISKQTQVQKRILICKKREYMPLNLHFLLTDKNSPIEIHKLIQYVDNEKNREIMIPENFSIIDNEKESFLVVKQLLAALLLQGVVSVDLNYENCHHVDLTTQVFLDSLLLDYVKFRDNYYANKEHRLRFTDGLMGHNIIDKDINRLMFSVGTPASLQIKQDEFPDVVKCPLCIHDGLKEKDYVRRIEQKDLDTTELVEYVVDSLSRMNKVLTSAKLEALCTVIGEILINAEEHSSTKTRYSAGYFREKKIGNKHYGVFRLVIMNYGETIYDKFKDPQCKNVGVVEKMSSLSKHYEKNRFFLSKKFEEETLWTLYALQDGVSSVSPDRYHRGNGTMRFIDNFFEIKGSRNVDSESKMTLISGKTRIKFDGTYDIVDSINEKDEKYQLMTFNKSGQINEKPDNQFVYAADVHFPGTIISVKLFLNDDDFEK